MLQSLYIENIAIIDKLSIGFDKNLCVLTGETGAGKSILLDSLGLAIGDRANSSLLKSGKEKAVVAAEFIENEKLGIRNEELEVYKLLEEHGVEIEDGSLILKRILYKDGKSKALINDVPVSAKLLQKIGSQLIEIHGQHDRGGLLSQKNHIKFLDEFAGLSGALNNLKTLYKDWQKIEVEIAELNKAQENAVIEEEYLTHAVKELQDLDLQENEEEELNEKRTILKNKEKIINGIKSALSGIKGNNVESIIYDSVKSLLKSEQIGKSGENIEKAAESFNKAGAEITEGISLLEDFLYSFEADGLSLEEVEDRLFTLRAAARKYLTNIEGLKEKSQEFETKLQQITNFEESLKKLAQSRKIARDEYLKLAKIISDTRTEKAKILEKRLIEEVTPLHMQHSRFKVQIEELPESSWSSQGFEKINFLASTNPGMPLGNLDKIASGGELSRFMLGMKIALKNTNSISSIIFDEIDTGIGGKVADAVGEKLRKLAEDNLQILVVTHQPQVAAKAHFHLKVLKEQKENHTTTNVTQLSREERKLEIARMLAGKEITDEAVRAAEKLLQVA